MTKIDHENRIGKNYQPKPTPSDEVRRDQSQKMKDHNRKTGNALTALGNRRCGFGVKKARKI